jgi:hypothetical protein
MKLEKAMGGLMVVLGIVGMFPVGAWLDQLDLVMPEYWKAQIRNEIRGEKAYLITSTPT